MSFLNKINIAHTLQHHGNKMYLKFNEETYRNLVTFSHAFQAHEPHRKKTCIVNCRKNYKHH